MISKYGIANAQRILILSGEGYEGTYSEYTGKRTVRALKSRLTKERCGGDRWARAYISAGPQYKDGTYYDAEGDDIRTVDDSEVD